jgi:tRNA modification GTPase
VTDVPSNFVRPLTPPGSGAVSVFRLTGPDSAAFAAARFVPVGSRPLGVGQLRVGRFDFGDGVVDHVVLRTSSDGREIDVACHGAPALRARAALLGVPASDARTTPALAGPADLAAAAEAALRTAFADEQVRFLCGAAAAFSAAVRAVVDALAKGDDSGADAALARLAAAAPAGLAAVKPPVVVLAGAVNAGKSTLFNALLREARALTSPEPGTTRDVVEERCSLGGFPFVLRDTAGWREAADPVERAGVVRARGAAAAADVVVRVVDAARTLEAQDAGDLRTPPPRGVVVVVARADAAVPGGADDELAAAGVPGVRCAAAQGVGVDAVVRAVVAASAFGAGIVPDAPFTPSAAAAARVAREALCRGDVAAAKRAWAPCVGDAS